MAPASAAASAAAAASFAALVTRAWQPRAFAAALAFFHASEFALVAAFDRGNLSARSLLFSWPYAAAMACAAAEYGLTAALAPGLKQTLLNTCSVAGLVVLCAGEALRKAAMLTARGAFTHDIQRRRREGHELVDWGVYRYIRHPGYLGWLAWAVGGQILLANPLCTAAFALVAVKFFRARIAYEEAALRHMFGGAYAAYAAVTPAWIPAVP